MMLKKSETLLLCQDCVHCKVCAYKDYYKQCFDAIDKAINGLSFSQIVSEEFEPGYLRCRHYKYEDTPKNGTAILTRNSGVLDQFSIGGGGLVCKLMTVNEYQQLALRTANPTLSWSEQLQNGLMGLNGEAGEAIELLKKTLFQGHPMDRERMAKELGDVAWYLALSADSLGLDLETVLQMNVDKLEARYPNGFSPANSMDRYPNDN